MRRDGSHAALGERESLAQRPLPWAKIGIKEYWIDCAIDRDLGIQSVCGRSVEESGPGPALR